MYLHLVRLAFFSQDIRLGTISCHKQVPQAGHLGHNQLVGLNKVLGSRDEALKDAKQLDGCLGIRDFIEYFLLLLAPIASQCPTTLLVYLCSCSEILRMGGSAESPVICSSSATAESAAAPCS